MTLALTSNTLLISGFGAGGTAIVGIIVRAIWARISGASGDDPAGDLAYYVSQKKISADDAAKLLAAAGTGSGDINEMASSVAQKKMSADEAAKDLIASDPQQARLDGAA
jgi:hypothetical protein